MILETKLDKNKKYLLACSFGPDSMALFHYLATNGFNFEVAHVNYHLQKLADENEKVLLDYANKFNIKVHSLRVFKPKKVNEEGWARDVRYEYFVKLANSLKIKDVLIAHNIDDLVETYLLQKERNNIVSYYGLKEVMTRQNINVIRPLLNYRKVTLLNYCNEHKIPYSLDPSNEDINYKRNNYRKFVVAPLNDLEIKSYIKEINEKNNEITKYLKNINHFFINKTIDVTSDEFKNIDVLEFNLLLISLYKKHKIYTPISRGQALEILMIIKEHKGNWEHKINDKYTLYLEYGILSIHPKQKSYKYVLKDDINDSPFKINKSSKDYELIKDKKILKIKNISPTELYLNKGKELKVNRLFISMKLPLSMRSIWPGIYDENDTLIYVPRYQKEPNSNKGLLIFDLSSIYK